MKTSLKYIALFFLFLIIAVAIAPGKRTNKRDSYFRKLAKSESAANPYYIIISKKKYELRVYDDKGWYATYPCVFGSNDLRDKYMAGDKRTPEGNFKVRSEEHTSELQS